MLQHLLPVLLFTLSSAQAPVVAGQRVRITSTRYELHRQTGQVLSVNAEGVSVRFERARTALHPDTLTLSNGSVDRWEVSRGEGRQTRLGAFIGLGTGAILGWAIGTSTSPKECVPESPYGFNCFLVSTATAEIRGLVGAMGLGVLGAGVGGLLGTLFRSERWEDVSRAPATVLRWLPDGHLGVGFALSF